MSKTKKNQDIVQTCVREWNCMNPALKGRNYCWCCATKEEREELRKEVGM